MQKLKILLKLIIAISTLTLAACTETSPCAPVLTVKANSDANCSLGGTVCGPCDGDICVDRVGPFNDYCTTVYTPGGGKAMSCACKCQ
jgi:hypothetical protein